MFYNCLSEYGYEDFYPLVEKYSLLKNMNLAGLPFPLHARLYPHLQEARREILGGTTAGDPCRG